MAVNGGDSSGGGAERGTSGGHAAVLGALRLSVGCYTL
jgi:hypothetical protein